MKNQILAFCILLLFVSCTEKSQESQSEVSLTDINQVKNEEEKSDSLSLTGIKEIPIEVFEKTWLTYLSVIGQDCCLAGVECLAIREIPKEIENLKNLETLSLTLNYIRELPTEILELKSLKTLDLTDNTNFSDIETVSKMKWLEEFYCYGCHLSKEEVEYLKEQLPNCKIGANY
ncbi:hypothetical protein [Bernardetia sp. MNP-M8]|uniref:leucine-rich repeat domain-containing protein n=1 Tax=Bernardetia sp. MNP-M8 TaxID=3127470 RepID=UPI0030CE9A63